MTRSPHHHPKSTLHPNPETSAFVDYGPCPRLGLPPYYLCRDLRPRHHRRIYKPHQTLNTTVTSQDLDQESKRLREEINPL